MGKCEEIVIVVDKNFLKNKLLMNLMFLRGKKILSKNYLEKIEYSELKEFWSLSIWV